jgi:hypothetical protein
MPEKPYDHQQIELKWQERWNNCMLSHRVTTKVPVDALVGEEMVIFRTSRRPYKHNYVAKGERVEIWQGKRMLAAGIATDAATVYEFCDVPKGAIDSGYYAKACTRDTLLKCLQEMYSQYGFDETTPTVVIRCIRTE